MIFSSCDENLPSISETVSLNIYCPTFRSPTAVVFAWSMLEMLRLLGPLQNKDLKVKHNSVSDSMISKLMQNPNEHCNVIKSQQYINLNEY